MLRMFIIEKFLGNAANILVQPFSGVPRKFVRGWGSTNSVGDRENGDLAAVAP